MRLLDKRPECNERKPGDMWFTSGYWYKRKACSAGWTNCDHKHLVVVLPNDSVWDMDSRASNCTKMNDNIHRCWRRHGTPSNITVDKDGETCGAGAGSIMMNGWHGFLRNGEFVDA